MATYSYKWYHAFDDYDTYQIFKGPKIAIDEFVSKHKNEISEHGLLNRLYYIVKNR
jgi:hypothetical protein